MKKYYKKIQKMPLMILGMIGSLLVLVVTCLVFSESDIFEFFSTDKYLFSYYAEELDEESYFWVDNNELLGYYASDDEGRFYVTSVADLTTTGDFAGYTYMGFYVYNKDVDLAEQIVEETYEKYGEADTWISGRGFIGDMSYIERQYFKEWFEEGEADEELLDKLCYKTFYLIPTSEAMKTDWGEVAGFLIFLGLSLTGFILCICRVTYGYKKKIVKFMRQNNLDEERLAYELDTGVNLKAAVISNKYVLAYNLAEVFKTEEFVWIYKTITTTTNRYYGIPISKTKTYAVVLYSRDGRWRDIPVANEAAADEMIDALSRRAPYVIYGYSDELAQIRTRNFSQLVQTVDERKANGVY